MFVNTQRNVFERNDLSRRMSPLPVQQRRCKVSEKGIQSVYSVINIFLWLHGIGFTQKMNLNRANRLRTIASILILVLMEGNIMYIGYALTKSFYKLDTSLIKGHSAFLVLNFITFITRLLFYARRKSLKVLIKKLVQIYSTVCAAEKRAKKFKVKLIVTLLVQDIASTIFILNEAFKLIQCSPQEFSFGFIKYPYAIPTNALCCILLNFYYVHIGVVAYFSLVCFALKGVLSQLKKNLQGVEDFEFVLEKYRKVTNLISDANAALHPFLLTALTTILFSLFRQGYFVLFTSEDKLALCVTIALEFSGLVIICSFSTSVIEEAEKVRSAAKCLPLNVLSPKYSQYSFQINESFTGFKILNSIVLDSSLVLTAVGALLTYGILIATFATASGP